jgi:16S rRNA processing protein RimM
MASGQSRWVPVAAVQRPHGVRGELRLHLFEASSRSIRVGTRLWLARSESSPPPTASECPDVLVADRVRPVPGGLLVVFRDVTSRERAAELAGRLVCIERSELPALEDDEVYVADLEGAAVWLRDAQGDRQIGVAQGVVDYPSVQALSIQLLVGDSPSGAVADVPFREPFVVEIDVEGRRVVVQGVEDFLP